MEKEKKKRFADERHLCALFFSYSLIRMSFVSAVFDFNASLSDVAPLSLILLSVDVKRNDKSESLKDAICVSSFFCFHHTDRVL